MYWNPFDSAHSGRINASDGWATILRFTSGRSLVGCWIFFFNGCWWHSCERDNKPHISALGQTLRMAAHALDWGYSLIQHHKGGKRNTMVMMFVGGVVLMLDRILVLFLL
jgi:hypothetical protein